NASVPGAHPLAGRVVRDRTQGGMAVSDIEERITSALAPYRLDDSLMPRRDLPRPPSRLRRGRLGVTLAAAAALAVAMVALAVVLPIGAGGADAAVASLLARFG